MDIVIDTNVLIAALLSNKGAAYRLLDLIDSDKIQVHLSVPLILEYEYVTFELADKIGLNEDELNDVLDHLCTIAEHHKIYYLWRPFLKDPMDDMVLELAVSAQCKA